MKNLTNTDLHDIELARLKQSHLIADSFEARDRLEPLERYMKTYRDYVTASNENEEAFLECVGKILYSISPEVTECHTAHCIASVGVTECRCMPDRILGRSMGVEIL